MKKLLGKKLLVVVAHPDDESFAAGGTIYKNNKLGGETAMICATLGERGASHLKKPVAKNRLKQIRKNELKNACGIMGVKKLFIMNLRDGRVRFGKDKVYEEILSVSDKFKPDAILSFGEDGITGHQDHVAVHRAAIRAAKKLKAPFFAFTLSPVLLESAERWIRQRRKARHYKRRIVRKKPNVKIPINPGIKLRILRQHKSQIDEGDPFGRMPRKTAKEVLRAEYFVAGRCQKP